jgi:hypothetical protein
MLHKNFQLPSAQLTLTPQQCEAVQDIDAFLKSDGQYLYVLKGYAGTGKTYCIEYLLNHVIRGTVCCTAPTHAAVRVIEVRIRRPGKTIQSLLGLRPNTDLVNFDIANPQFDPKGTERIKEYSVVIIDECSQINRSLFILLSNRALSLKTKLIFMGDPCQLPPINERHSNTFNIPNSFTLTDIVRQSASHPLHTLFSLLRYDVEHNTKTFITKIQNSISSHNTEGQGYKILNRIDFSMELVTYMNHDNFKNDLSYTRYTAYTNENIQATNIFIRTKILGGTPPTVHKDDLLTGYTTLIDENMSPIITNSDNYIIGAIEPYNDEFKIKSYAVNLINANTNTVTRTLVIVDHNDSETLNTYRQILTHYHYAAITASPQKRGGAWAKYYEFKKNHLCLIDIPINKTVAKRDLDYGYGLTTYKIQGSTIKNMFINIANMCYYKGIAGRWVTDSVRDPHAVEFMNKQIYTALSRTKDKAFLLYY